MLENIEFIIPCGGKSTRNYPQSKGIGHKCLLPFGDARLIDYVLAQIFAVGGRHITIVCSDEATIHSFKEALKPAPDVLEKLENKGLTKIASALKKVTIPEDADIKYTVQAKPLGTAHVLGLAHRISENRHGLMIFPDDIYVNKDEMQSHLKKLVDEFLKDEKQILIMGIEREDVSNNSIIEMGRLIEKPKNPSNNIGGFSPMVFPKACLDFIASHVKGLENGSFKPTLLGNEWVYTDGVNMFLDTYPNDGYTLKMFKKDEDATYMDTGALPFYERALLYSLLNHSVFKEENREAVKEFLEKN
ncbi:MAG: hypothetical protein J6U64_00780 [Alphaproteobacteria bacterium]|nr:hypothetical protein [Alphaproteobacteria bacterium]